MALKYTNYVSTPYGSPIVGQQIGLCTPSNVSPRACMVDIDWSKYTSGFVTVDLLGMSPGMKLDMIKSVYIDNIGMVLPVTVVFPDTQCEVTCQANATEAQSVLTGNLQANIILGTTSLSLSSIKNATSRIFFSNVPIESFLNPQTPQAIAYYEVSNSPGTPQAFAPKAAGEQRAWWQFDLSNNTVTDLLNGGSVATNLFANYPGIVLKPSSYLVITDIKAYITDAYLWKLVGGISNTKTTIFVGPNNLSLAGSYLGWTFPLGMDYTKYGYSLLQDSHGLFLQVNPYNSNAQMGVSYSPTTASMPVVGLFFLDIQFSYISTL